MNAPSARAEEPGLVSATRADPDEMNYAINLAGANPEDLQRALALVPGAGGAACLLYTSADRKLAASCSHRFEDSCGVTCQAVGAGKSE